MLLRDEPDNYLDVLGKLWLEQALLGSPKTVLTVRTTVLARAVDRIITVELGGAGNTAWIHGGSFTSYQQARADQFARLDELRRRWDEEHAKLKALVVMYAQKAASSAQVLQDALETFDGTVLAVTHNRWFAARSFDRFLIFTADGYVREEPAYSAGAAELGRPGCGRGVRSERLRRRAVACTGARHTGHQGTTHRA